MVGSEPGHQSQRTPAVALVGRPNVGKSTLFNRLCGGRAALVADHAGLTRDRRYGRADVEGRVVSVIDTGGLGEAGLAGEDIAAAVALQAHQAIDEADLVVMLVDARAGLAPADEDIAADLRRRGVAVRLAANKIDGVDPSTVHEFWRLGLGEPLPISASHGRGVAHLKAVVEAALPDAASEDAAGEGDKIRVAVIGRPNVGKSTLVNRLLGAERQVVFDKPGTTRDAIEIPFGDHVLIDTAGLRRRGRVSEAVEKFSIVKTLDALERSHVALLLLDAREGLVDQDLQLLRHAADAGTGLLLLVNKWDGLTPERRAQVRAGIDRRLDFAPWVSVRYVSALTGAGVGKLMAVVDGIHRAGSFEVGTPQLNRILDQATRAHPPPAVRGRAIKLRYVHKTGAHPPALMLHGNRTDLLPASYLRFLENRFRDALDLAGMPLHISTRSGENPWAGVRNELTRRQVNRRKRLIRHRLSRRRPKG